MSRQADEKRQPKKGAKKAEGSDVFVAFRPSPAQKEAIAAQNLTPGDCLDVLQSLLEAGHKLAVGYRAENDTYYAQLREGGRDWRDAICLSCWHAQWERCLQMLAYAVTEVYPHFPDQVQLPLNVENW